MSASDLDLALRRLGQSAEWPPTPQFRALPPPRSRRYLVAALVAAVAALTFAAAAIASGELLRSVTITRSPHELTTPSPTADPLLGRVEPSVVAAAHDAGFPVLVPQRLGPPDAVTLRQSPATIVSLAYAPRPGLPASPGDPAVGALVSEYRGTGSTQFVGKLVGPGTAVQSVDVGGHPGVWISGSPHQVFVPNGGVDTLRLATNTLLWEQDGTTYRLEAGISLADALAIAGTMH